ncbi:MAG: diacylglycerol kinase, partial [Cyclobacteriaceae bacterium]|nr:diacylglycerol kinase [Cyclobacteriaceae bacterium]
ICIGLVIFLELLDSSIEGIVDLVNPEWQVKAGKIKESRQRQFLLQLLYRFSLGYLFFPLIFLEHGEFLDRYARTHLQRRISAR